MFYLSPKIRLLQSISIMVLLGAPLMANATEVVIDSDTVVNQAASYLRNSDGNDNWTNNALFDITSTGGNIQARSAGMWTNNGTVDLTGGNVAFFSNGNWTNNDLITASARGNINAGGNAVVLNAVSGDITFDAEGDVNFGSIVFFQNLGTVNITADGYVYSDGENWFNGGTYTALSRNDFIDIHAVSGTWQNDGAVTATAQSINASSEGDGNWLNTGTLTLNGVSGGTASIIGGYGAGFASINRGTINVTGDNRFGLAEGADEHILENYGDIILDAGAVYGRFDMTQASPVFNTADYSSIVNKKGISEDPNALDTDDAVVALKMSGVTDFKTVRVGRVIQNGADVMGAGMDLSFDPVAAFSLLNGTDAVFLNEGETLDVTGNTVISVSLYSYRNGAPSVNPTLVLEKTGDGALTLSGNNTYYNGVFNVTSGDLTIMGASSMPGGIFGIVNGASLTFGGNDLYTATVKQFNGGGMINMKVDLDEANPVGDMLRITETVNGNTLINLVNIGNSGMADELKIIDMTNSVTGVTADSFALVGGKFDAGPYVYYLHYGDLDGVDANSFYLGTERVISDTFKAMKNVPMSELVMIYTGMNSLEKRMGDIRCDDPAKPYGVWARGYAKQARIKDGIKTDMTLEGVEAGMDIKYYTDEQNTLYVGVMAGFMGVNNIKANAPKKSDGDGTAPSVGLYGTWVHEDGWYADAAVRSFWTDLDLKSYDSSENAIKYGPKRQFTAASLEIGKEFCINDILIEPGLKLSYAYGKSADETINNGGRLEYGVTDSLRPRLGVKISESERTAFNPYVAFGATYEILGKTDVIYNNVKEKSDLSGASGDVEVGFDAKVGNNLSLYGELGFEQGSKITAYSGNFGLRYTFGTFRKIAE